MDEKTQEKFRNTILNRSCSMRKKIDFLISIHNFDLCVSEAFLTFTTEGNVILYFL